MRQKYLKHIPNNDRNGKYLDYMDEGNKLTNKDLYKILSHQMHRFTKCETMRKIKKDGFIYSYIRVTEPHEDGTPHFHLLMYLPEKFIPGLYLDFHKFFPAPRNSKKLTTRDGGRKAEKIFDKYYETQGFQIKLRNPAGYILKYILKSFKNLSEDKELDYLQAWYVFNKIPRIITTHTTIPQDVYYHASLLDDDWFYLSNLKTNDYYSRDNIFNTFAIGDDKRLIEYDNGHYKLTFQGYVVKEFGENKMFKMKFTTDCPQKYPRVPNIPTSLTGRFWRCVPKRKYVYKIHQPSTIVEVQLPNLTFLLYDTQTGNYGKRRDFLPINHLTDLDLFEWFYNYDMDKCGTAKFGYLKKIMMKRGLLKVEPDFNLNDFNIDFNIKDFE